MQAIFIRTTLEKAAYNLMIVGRNTSNSRPSEALFLGRTDRSGRNRIVVFGVCGGLLIRRALLAEVHRINQTTAAIMPAIIRVAWSSAAAKMNSTCWPRPSTACWTKSRI